MREQGRAGPAKQSGKGPWRDEDDRHIEEDCTWGQARLAPAIEVLGCEPHRSRGGNKASSCSGSVIGTQAAGSPHGSGGSTCSVKACTRWSRFSGILARWMSSAALKLRSAAATAHLAASTGMSDPNASARSTRRRTVSGSTWIGAAISATSCTDERAERPRDARSAGSRRDTMAGETPSSRAASLIEYVRTVVRSLSSSAKMCHRFASFANLWASRCSRQSRGETAANTPVEGSP